MTKMLHRPCHAPCHRRSVVPFFDAAAEGKLLLRLCLACQRFMTYSRVLRQLPGPGLNGRSGPARAPLQLRRHAPGAAPGSPARCPTTVSYRDASRLSSRATCLVAADAASRRERGTSPLPAGHDCQEAYWKAASQVGPFCNGIARQQRWRVCFVLFVLCFASDPDGQVLCILTGVSC